MPTDQQTATEFAQGFAAFSAAVALVLKIGDVQAALDAANKTLADVQAKITAAYVTLDNATADGDATMKGAASSAAETIANAKTSAAAAIAEGKAAADAYLNSAVAEASRQKADLDEQIVAARAQLAGLTAEDGASKP